MKNSNFKLLFFLSIFTFFISKCLLFVYEYYKRVNKKSPGESKGFFMESYHV